MKKFRGQRTTYPGMWRDLLLVYAAVFLPMLLLACAMVALEHLK